MNQYTGGMSRQYIKNKSVLWQIRLHYLDYKQQYAEILESSPASLTDKPHGTAPGDPTAAKAVKVAKLSSFINAVEKSLEKIPAEYRKGVWNRVLFGKQYPFDASRATYERWTRRYLTEVSIWI